MLPISQKPFPNYGSFFNYVASHLFTEKRSFTLTALNGQLSRFSFDCCKESTLNIYFIFLINTYCPIFQKVGPDSLLAKFSNSWPRHLLSNFSKSWPRQSYSFFLNYLRHFLIAANFSKTFSDFSFDYCKQSFVPILLCLFSSSNEVAETTFLAACVPHLTVIFPDSPLFAANSQLWIYILYFWQILIGKFFKNMSAGSLLANFSKSCPPAVIFLFP